MRKTFLMTATALMLVFAADSGPALADPAPNVTTMARTINSNPNTAPADAPDPRAFLDEITGEAALQWVEARNSATYDRLKQDPRFEQNRAAALAILEATDRVPFPRFAKGGFVDNFWQDSDHKQGLWRRTTWESYTSAAPQWDVILDIDALSRAEGKTWVYKGADCLPPSETRCLISLAEGGTDAVVIREFDVTTKTFVEGGFSLPEGKQYADWIDEDTIYLAREWTPGEMTASGYPYVTKRLKRGETLDQAVEVHRGKSDDMVAMRSPLRDVDGSYVIDIAVRSPSFFEQETTYFTDNGPVQLPFPLTTEFSQYLHGQAIYKLKDTWTSAGGKTFAPGAIISVDLKAALADPANVEPLLLFQPNEHESVDAVSVTADRVVLTLLSNVTGEIRSFAYKDGAWTSKTLGLPANSSLDVTSASDETNDLFVTSEGFLQPATLYRVSAVTGEATAVKSAPARFNPTGLKVTQRWVTSKDGTRVPYFLITKDGVTLDGSTPTLLYAYGGFEVSLAPWYSGTMGRLWLENGGAYALANIRGGGEFGPAWHEAGLKTNRQRIYDDFQAVAEDLIGTGVTSPRRLGIMGGSNGGLLMGVQFTQRPDLWNAVVIQVPLLDMVNYTRMSAGASWQGEYGNPEDPVEGAFLRSISPYHNVRAGVAYPEPLIETSTKDDRVGPVHARKMAALLEDMGLPYFYYENTQGGHSAAANLAETAYRSAVEYTYLMQKLMD